MSPYIASAATISDTEPDLSIAETRTFVSREGTLIRIGAGRKTLYVRADSVE